MLLSKKEMTQLSLDKLKRNTTQLPWNGESIKTHVIFKVSIFKKLKE